jgi:putative transposase
MAGVISRSGGRREGAGRKRAARNQKDPRHSARPALDYRNPVHVILHTCSDVPRLRQRRVYEALRGLLFLFLVQPDLRVIHISLQRNHIHMIVEARDKDALSRGMRAFAGGAARAINKALERRGKVFQFRYNAKQIKTREYARNAIAYVLNNWRKHKASWSSPTTRSMTTRAPSRSRVG